jgi:hypothetical protein
MRKQTPDTEIVFRDLSQAYKKLHESYESPNMVRFWFITFVTLTQKLTETMRKEYSAITTLKWKPVTFPGWNAVTEFFKELRNTDYHKLPIRIMIIQTQVYEGFRIDTDELGNEKEIPTRLHTSIKWRAEPQKPKRCFQLRG